MYTYSFNIYHKHSPYVFLAIFMEAKDRLSSYRHILIRKYNEKPEDWSTSVVKSCEKEVPYSGKHFFEWLGEQRYRGYTGRISPFSFSPHQLYSVLNTSMEYDVLVDTDDPADIGDPGFDDDDYDPDVVY